MTPDELAAYNSMMSVKPGHTPVPAAPQPAPPVQQQAAPVQAAPAPQPHLSQDEASAYNAMMSLKPLPVQAPSTMAAFGDAMNLTFAIPNAYMRGTKWNSFLPHFNREEGNKAINEIRTKGLRGLQDVNDRYSNTSPEQLQDEAAGGSPVAAGLLKNPHIAGGVEFATQMFANPSNLIVPPITRLAARPVMAGARLVNRIPAVNKATDNIANTFQPYRPLRREAMAYGATPEEARQVENAARAFATTGSTADVDASDILATVRARKGAADIHNLIFGGDLTLAERQEIERRSENFGRDKTGQHRVVNPPNTQVATTVPDQELTRRARLLKLSQLRVDRDKIRHNIQDRADLFGSFSGSEHHRQFSPRSGQGIYKNQAVSPALQEQLDNPPKPSTLGARGSGGLNAGEKKYAHFDEAAKDPGFNLAEYDPANNWATYFRQNLFNIERAKIRKQFIDAKVLREMDFTRFFPPDDSPSMRGIGPERTGFKGVANLVKVIEKESGPLAAQEIVKKLQGMGYPINKPLRQFSIAPHIARFAESKKGLENATSSANAAFKGEAGVKTKALEELQKELDRRSQMLDKIDKDIVGMKQQVDNGAGSAVIKSYEAALKQRDIIQKLVNGLKVRQTQAIKMAQEAETARLGKNATRKPAAPKQQTPVPEAPAAAPTELTPAEQFAKTMLSPRFAMSERYAGPGGRQVFLHDAYDITHGTIAAYKNKITKLFQPVMDDLQKHGVNVTVDGKPYHFQLQGSTGAKGGRAAKYNYGRGNYHVVSSVRLVPGHSDAPGGTLAPRHAAEAPAAPAQVASLRKPAKNPQVQGPQHPIVGRDKIAPAAMDAMEAVARAGQDGTAGRIAKQAEDRSTSLRDELARDQSRVGNAVDRVAKPVETAANAVFRNKTSQVQRTIKLANDLGLKRQESALAKLYHAEVKKRQPEIAKELLEARLRDEGNRQLSENWVPFMSRDVLSDAQDPLIREFGRLGNYVAARPELFHFFKEQGAPIPAAKGLMIATEMINKFSRMGIIANPFVHVLWNLNLQFLGSRGNLRDYLDILNHPGLVRMIGKKGWKPTDDEIHDAFQHGALAHFSPLYEGIMGGAYGKMIGSAKELNPLERLDKTLTTQWKMMQHFVFENMETRFAVKRYQQFIREGMGKNEAGIATRKVLGDYANVSRSGLEKGFNEAMFFYPWVKTIIPFWLKALTQHPQAWNAPMQGIRANNANMGDPNLDHERPFIIEIGKNADGSPRYFSVPDPARIIDDVLALLAPNGRLDAGVDERFAAGQHVVEDHFNPMLGFLSDLEQTHSAPAAQPGDDSPHTLYNKAAPGDVQFEQFLGSGLSRLAPFPLMAKQMETFLQEFPEKNPKDVPQEIATGTAAAVLGGTSYSRPIPAKEREKYELVKHEATTFMKLKSQGNYDAARQQYFNLLERLKLLNEAPGAQQEAVP